MKIKDILSRNAQSLHLEETNLKDRNHKNKFINNKDWKYIK